MTAVCSRWQKNGTSIGFEFNDIYFALMLLMLAVFETVESKTDNKNDGKN